MNLNLCPEMSSLNAFGMDWSLYWMYGQRKNMPLEHVRAQ